MASYPYVNAYGQYPQSGYLNYLSPLAGQQPTYMNYQPPLVSQQPGMVGYSYPTSTTALPTQMATQVQQPQQNSGIIWVQGEAGAKSYLVGAGQSVLLMDSENSSFYLKSTDASGMPMPLRVFDYVERGQQPVVQAAAVPASNDYVTHEELKQWSDKLRSSISKEGRQDGRKPSV